MRLLACILITVTALSSVGFGATFSDLGDAPWAVTYINRMADLGVVSGYLGKFNPNDSLSKYAAISTIYRTIEVAGKLEGESIAVYKAKHLDTMKSYNVPDWTGLYEAVAFCLEKEIIHRDELSTFVIGAEHQNVKRSEVSVYLGKTLNLYLDENVNTIISLSFKDANQITTSSAPYVNLLVKQGIISGTPEGYFKPYDEITRAAMTKMLSDSYDILKDIKKVELTYKTGNVSFVLDDTKKLIVSESSDSVENEIYSIDDSVKIFKDGTQKSFSAFQKGQDVELGFDGLNLVEVKILTTSGDIKGTVRSVSDRNGYYRFEIYVEDDNDDQERETYSSVSDLKEITLDGEKVKPDKLTSGDEIILVLDDDDKVIDAVASSKYQRYEGILNSSVNFQGKPKISIQLDEGETKSFELDPDDVDIERNDDSVEITDLVVGDYVKVKTAYGLVVDIEAISLNSRDVEGYIEEIIIADIPKIKIRDNDNDLKEYPLHSSVDIEIENDDKEIYDLRLNYKVELELEGNSVVKIDAEKTSEKDQLSGTISKMYTDINIITVRNKLSSGSEYVSVSYNSDTEFIDGDGDSISESKLDEDDTVFVYGTYRDAYFLAQKVILLD